MNPKDHEYLLNIYMEKPSEELAYCIAATPDDYQADTLLIMREILTSRGLDQAYIDQFIPAPANLQDIELPPELCRGLFPVYLHRAFYLLRCGTIVLSFLFMGFLIERWPASTMNYLFIPFLLLFIYFHSYIIKPRLKSAGWSPLIMWAFFIPITYPFILTALALAAPKKKRQSI